MRRFLVAVAFAALLVCAAVLPTYYASLMAYAMVLALLGTSVNITVGYLGLISFGHAAFFGLGAYTGGLLAVKLGMNFWLASVAAIVPGVLLGILVGVASLRLAGPYFAIATLVTAEILRLVAGNWVSLTRGPLGVVIPRPRLRALEDLGLNFAQYHAVICVVALGLVLALVSRLVSSPYGRAWMALRDQQRLAESIGISALRYRIAAIGLSGGIAALAGALLVPKILVLSPDLFSVTISATGLLAATLGGKGTVLGPVIGGAIFAVAPELLRFVDEYRVALFAVILLLIVRIKPDGLAALLPKPQTSDRALGQAPADLIAARGSGDLIVAALSKQFGGLKAVSDVSFTVRRGEILGLIGPNGAGKTTCLSLVSGFLPATSGSVAIGRDKIESTHPHQVARTGLVRTFQHTTLCTTMTAFGNVLVGTHLLLPENPVAAVLGTPAYRAREADRAAWAWVCIDAVGLRARADAKAGAMAYGEQRMLSIAVALAARPGFLLLDEPAAGLNHTEAAGLGSLLRGLRDEGLTIVIVDHNLRMMMRLCDRLVVLHHGQMLAEGDPISVRNHGDVIAAYLGHKAQPGDATLAPT